MKWDIKADINSNSFINSDINYSYHKTDNSSNFSKSSYNERTINDIFPSNYYKITESIKNKNDKNHRNSFNILFSSTPKIIEENTNHRDSKLSNKLIERDISQNNICSYKLRIYKRFINDNVLHSSSISYNFITRELRFNTKGIPEYILDKCISSTIPDNFEKLISFYRRRGYIIIICASKKINMDIDEAKKIYLTMFQEWRKEHGDHPSLQSPDPNERRMAEAIRILKNYKIRRDMGLDFPEDKKKK